MSVATILICQCGNFRIALLWLCHFVPIVERYIKNPIGIYISSAIQYPQSQSDIAPLTCMSSHSIFLGHCWIFKDPGERPWTIKLHQQADEGNICMHSGVPSLLYNCVSWRFKWSDSPNTSCRIGMVLVWGGRIDGAALPFERPQ